MQWIDVKALETWATFLNAREMVMAMLADLIRMTIDDASRFRFPSGEASCRDLHLKSVRPAFSAFLGQH